jgi:autotransporter-associated beta strand protein
MKPKYFRQPSLILAAVALAGFAFTAPTASAANIYWDPNSSGSFGTINGTTVWASPLNIVWTNSPTGGSTRLRDRTTTFSDDCNWGGPTAALGGGTVPIATVEAGTLSFNTISGTGTVTLSGGTITLKDATSIFALTASQTHTISSTLAGATTSLTKLGVGTIVLSGGNTYTGSTIISTGILSLGSNLALQSSPLNATSSVTGDATNGLKTTVTALTFGGLEGTKDLASLFTTTAGGFDLLASLTLNPGPGVTHTYSGAIVDGAVGMTLTKSGLGAQVLSGINSYTGATSVNSGTLTLDYSTQDTSKLSDTAALVLGNGTIELSGGTHTEVVASTTLTGASKVVGTPGSAKLALGDVTGTGSIDFSADGIATTTTPNNSSGILPFATIGGINSARNDGSGNIVTYVNYTDIDARGPSTIPNTPLANVRIIGDGTSGAIELAAATTTISTLLQGNANFASTINTAGKTLLTTGITIAGSAEALNVGAAPGDGTLQTGVSGGTLALTNANAAKVLTINAGIADNTTASGLSKGGAGALVLAGANTYTGSTVIDEGSLTLSGSLASSGILVGVNAVFNESATGSIGGAATFTHNGSFTSTLAGANTYGGATGINNGVVNIQHGSALGSTAEGTAVASGAALQLQGDITVGDEALTLNGAGNSNTGALRSLGGNNTYGGLLTLGSSTRINSDADTLTFSNPGTITGAGISLAVGGAGDTTIQSIIGTGSGFVAKDGTGRLTLTAANTFTGSVTVTAGALNIQTSTGVGTTAGGVTVGNGAALELQGGITVGNEVLILSGSGISGGGALRNMSGDNIWGGAITAGNTTVRINSDAGTLTIDVPSGFAFASSGVAVPNPVVTFGGNGDIVVADPINSGVGGVAKDGDGVLTLSATNIYTTATTISAGTLVVQGSISTSSGITNNSALIFNSGAAQSFAKIISGSGTLTKTGAGTLTLTGANTYTGATTVTEGMLIANGSQPEATGDVSVSADATLGGTGTLGGNTLIADNGKLEFSLTTPADSHDPLELEVGKTLTFVGTSTLTLTTTPSGGASPGKYILLTAPGGISGSVPAAVKLPPGWTADPPVISGSDLTLNITSTGLPEIAVEGPAFTDIPNNGSESFGELTLGSNASLTFTIRNTGTAALKLTGSPLVNITGANAADFTVTAMPTTPVTLDGGTTTFTVRFSPLAAGVRNAALSIANSDSDENPFVINLSGTGTGEMPYDAWAGGAAFEDDANGDGVKNGLAFLLGAADPSADASGLLPVVTKSGGNLVLTFNCLNAASRGHAALSVQHSSDLGIADPWTAAAVPETSGGPVSGVSFAVTPGSPLNRVVATIQASQSASGSLFGSLKAEP